MKKVIVLGSTGSIGTQASEVITRNSNILKPCALVAKSSGERLLEQCLMLGVKVACLVDLKSAESHRAEFEKSGIELLSGEDGLLRIINEADYDIALNSLVGFSGLLPTLQILSRGKTLALANKESLVAGGKLVMDTSKRSGAKIVPVDSEHSAIFQCLQGEDLKNVRRIILTASGGPFRDFPISELERVKVEDALKHPTWKMGPKVTIDSATLMNKGLEILEAHHLFNLDIEKIEVVIHRQSIVHSLVEMVDGSVLAQLGVPDMKIPIQYALTYPERSPSSVSFLDILDVRSLTFEPVDTKKFPSLELARIAGRKSRTYPVALNASNEEAVNAFLSGWIGFTQIPAVVERVLENHKPLEGITYEEIIEADSIARDAAAMEIEKLKRK